MKIFALGDCNTYGDVHYKNNAFPERFAKCINAKLKNCGYTMSTTREMINFFNEFYMDDIDVVLIQYGLVDSWETFKYAPYVLYYPDNLFRKIYRKIIKKYKKVTKKLGLYKRFGSMNVVPIEEYQRNIEYVINSSKHSIIYLIDTVPSKESFRNKEIQRYNAVLDEIAKSHKKNVFRIKLYDHFLEHIDDYYLDHIHLNEFGYEFIAQKLCQHYVKSFKVK